MKKLKPKEVLIAARESSLNDYIKTTLLDNNSIIKSYDSVTYNTIENLIGELGEIQTKPGRQNAQVNPGYGFSTANTGVSYSNMYASNIQFYDPANIDNTTIKSFTNKKEEIEVDINYQHRCLIDSANNFHYIQCPQDTTLSDSELLDIALHNSSKNIMLIPKFPDVIEKKRKPLNLLNRKKVVNKDLIKKEVFYSKTNHLFNIPCSFDDFYKEYTKDINFDKFLGNRKNDTCAKGVVFYNRLKRYYGITTGKLFDAVNAEVISINVNSNNQYINSSSYKLENLDLNLAACTDKQKFTKFFRFRVKDYKKSAELLGAITSKKKLVGYITGYVEIYTGWHCKDGVNRNVIMIYNNSDGSGCTFLPEDIEIFTINENLLQKNSTKKLDKRIIVGNQAIVIDDKKLNNLSKRDIVTVSNIKVNNTNMKNSVVTVIDSNGIKQITLLKQLKSYYGTKTPIIEKKSNPKRKLNEEKIITSGEISF